MTVIKKNSKKKFYKHFILFLYYLKKLRLFLNYLANHPVAIIKAPLLFLINGPFEFFNKLKEIEYRQKKFDLVHKISFLLIVLLIKNLFINIIKFFFRFLFVLIYVPINIIFFLIFKLFSHFILPLNKIIKINKYDKKVNGISFVIPTWNNKNLVIDCIKTLDKIAVKESLDIPKEIIVIDNGSKDNTYESLLNLKTKTPLMPIRNETNLGFARAINQGVKKSQYNYVYLMNNDMIPKVDFISEIINFAKKLQKENNNFFGLSSQIFFSNQKKRREESGKNYYHPDFGFLYVAHCVNNINLKVPSITGYPGGGSSLINKELFLKLGGYDSDLFKPLYDEDLDLGFIAWRLGFPSYFVPTSQVIHHHRSSSKKLNKEPNYYMFKNWLTFILKNYDSSSLFYKYIFLYALRILSADRFMDYGWENLKIMPKILYKKITFLKYKTFYKDFSLIDFPKFEFDFYKKYEK